MVQRIAVLSDIHGNADALDVALSQVEAEAPDLVVILGDLLTYGTQPLTVLDRLDAFSRGNRARVFISGNHDEFYFGLETGDPGFYDRVPDFVRESVYWTQDRIAPHPHLSARYPWVRSHTEQAVVFAHANPYRYGDWRYVSDPEACRDAAATLAAMGARVGVFGHSHRAFAALVAQGAVRALDQGVWHEIEPEAVAIINPGAVGHPRGTGLSYLRLDVDGARIRADIRAIAFDAAAQRRAIAAAGFTAGTRDKLLSYWET
ncbi:MAG: metallophosphoesterase [Maritimibacter sp.]|nr:metallophosphoesterase [Maritimibacter sp.]